MRVGGRCRCRWKDRKKTWKDVLYFFFVFAFNYLTKWNSLFVNCLCVSLLNISFLLEKNSSTRGSRSDILTCVLIPFSPSLSHSGGSAALVADAGHSLSDMVTDVTTVFFMRKAKQPADPVCGQSVFDFCLVAKENVKGIYVCAAFIRQKMIIYFWKGGFF